MKNFDVGAQWLVMAVVLGLSPSAQSAPTTLSFAGTVTQTVFDPDDPYAGGLAVGSAVRASFGFAAAPSDASPAPDLGSYTWGAGEFASEITAGLVAFPAMDRLNITLVDGAPGFADQFLVFASLGMSEGLADYFSLSMLLEDETGTAFAGDGLPAVSPNVDLYSVRSFTIYHQYTAPGGVFFQYEVQGVLEVPSPGTLSLVAVGLLGVAGAGRKKCEVGS